MLCLTISILYFVHRSPNYNVTRKHYYHYHAYYVMTDWPESLENTVAKRAHRFSTCRSGNNWVGSTSSNTCRGVAGKNPCSFPRFRKRTKVSHPRRVPTRTNMNGFQVWKEWICYGMESTFKAGSVHMMFMFSYAKLQPRRAIGKIVDLPHMFLPISILKYPWSPQFSPHEFLMSQYGTPSSIPYPTARTAWLTSCTIETLSDF